jgi:hypothetical protein
MKEVIIVILIILIVIAYQVQGDCNIRPMFNNPVRCIDKVKERLP